MTYQINQELLEKLNCPTCEGSLKTHDENLQCIECKQVYPIVDGIIVLLKEEIEQEPRAMS